MNTDPTDADAADDGRSTARSRGQRGPVAITPAGILGTLLLAAVVLVFLRLGFWQLARLAEQRELNAGVAARLDAPAIDDAAALADTVGMYYRVVDARGLYDSDRSIVLPGRSRRGLPGVYLLTPLRLADRSDAVLVNRGWVPSADAATIEVDDFAIHDSVSISGLVLPFPGRAESLSLRGPADAGSFRRVWYTIDEPSLRGQFPYELLPATLQRLPSPDDATSGPGRYPAALDPPPLDEGSHLGYALQWFSFAVVGIIGWIALLMRARNPPRGAPPVAGLLFLALAAAPADAQLRPLDGMDWRIFDDQAQLIIGIGGGVLWDQPATLAATEGRLIEAGNYLVAMRSGRMAIELRGTALWQYREDTRTGEPLPVVVPADGNTRLEPGPASAAALMRLSLDSWPADIVVRFGATIPTTSDESGLERDRTDFFATVGFRYTRGPLTLSMENGVGINGTIASEYPQSDVWTYAFGSSLERGPVRAVANLVGRQDGHTWVMRGNEDQRELRLGFDVGDGQWLQLRYVVGLSDVSPGHGLRIGAGFTVGRDEIEPIIRRLSRDSPAPPAPGAPAKGVAARDRG